jgi:hypothetical protein
LKGASGGFGDLGESRNKLYEEGFLSQRRKDREDGNIESKYSWRKE